MSALPALPAIRKLNAGDFRDEAAGLAALMQAFNVFQAQTVAYLAALAPTAKTVYFSTDAFGVASVRVRHGMPGKPAAVGIGQISRLNGQPLGSTFGWSFEWVAVSGEALLSFVDLPSLVDLTANLEMR